MSDASNFGAGVTPILSFDEVSWAVKLSKIEIYRRVKKGKFPMPFRLGRKQAWPTAEVEAWLQEHIGKRKVPCANRQQLEAAMQSVRVRKVRKSSNT